MSPARYLLRFDDLCPTANWQVWDVVEREMDARGVRPLVAVVPDNQDESLVRGQADPAFWERVRGWQAKGWAIGLHGYQHRYVVPGGGILGLHARSEFAGLDAAAQGAKLDAALAVMKREGVRVDAWVAPGHSFDGTTVAELRRRGVSTISDGFFLRAGTSGDGVTWVPQQLWRLRAQRFGSWTVCYHVNSWTPAQVRRFADDLDSFAGALTTLPDLVQSAAGTRLGPADRAFAKAMRRAVLARRAVLRLRSRMRDRH